MTTELLQSLIEDINSQLDGVQVFRAIDYMPDKMRTVGDSLLKAFCPFHHPTDPNEKVPTFTINLSAKTYKCIKRGCDGNAGGTLVDLYARIRQVSPLQAAIELARHTGVEVEEDQLALAAQFAFEEARDKHTAGAFMEAFTHCEFALSLTPDQLDALKLKAALCDEMGRREEALQTVLRIVELCEAQDMHADALEVIESIILPKDPHNEAALLQAARLREKLGQFDQAIEYYLRVADDREEMNREEENLELLQHVAILAPTRLDLRSRLAGLYDDLNDAERAAGEYEFLAAEFEKKNELASAIEALHKLIDHRPDDMSLKERLAALLAKAGDTHLALEYWTSTADAWQAREEWDCALRCVGQALAIQPESLDAARRKGQILTASGRADEAQKHYLELFERLDKSGDLDEAYTALCLARDCTPMDVAIQQRITAWLTAQHRVEEAIEEMFRLSALMLESSKPAEGLATLRQISQMQPANKDIRLRVAAAFHDAGNAPMAMEEYKDLAQLLLDNGDAPAAIDVCTQAAAADPANPAIKYLMAQALETTGDTAAALDLYLDAFHTFDAQEQRDDAEETITRALDLGPDRPEIRQTLAEFYLRGGRRQDAIESFKQLLALHDAAERNDPLIATAKTILELDPDDISTRRRLAAALETAGRRTDAVGEYHKALRQLIAAANSEDAITVCNAILRLDGDDIDALRQAAALTLQTASPAEARPYFDRQLEVLKILEDHDAIQSLYDEMIGLYPSEHSLKRELAVWLIGAGREKEGIKRLLGLAEDFQNIGELEEVARIYEHLVEIKPKEQKYVAGLEETYRTLGQADKAAALCERQIGLAGKDRKRVIFWLERLTELQPAESDHCRRLAEVCEESGDTKAAIKHYRRLTALNEERGDTSLNIPVLQKLLNLAGEEAPLRLQLAQCLEQAGRGPEACLDYLIAAGAMIAGKDFTQAQHLAEKAVSLDRENIDAWNTLIKCHAAQNNTPELKQAWTDLAAIHETRGELGNAIACLESLRKIDPDDAPSGEALAALYERAGRPDQAFEEYHRVSRLLIDQESNAGALRLLLRMKEIRPADLDARRNIIILLDKEGRLVEAGDEALALARALFEQKNERDAISVVRRSVMFFDDNYDKHLQAFDLLIEFNCEAEAFALLLTSAQRAADNHEPAAARRLLERGLELDETNRPLREFKIRLLLEQGDTQAAAAEYISMARQALVAGDAAAAEQLLAQCVTIAPGHLEAHQLLADALQRLDRPDDAVREYQTIVDLASDAGNRPLAIEYNLKILDAQPGNTEVRERLANLYLEDNQQANAVEQFTQLAAQLLKSKKQGRARDIFQQVLRFDSSNLECRVQLADLEWNTGRQDDARTQYMSIITLLEKQGRADDIDARYRDLIERDPEHLKWRGDYAQFLAANNRTEEAAAQLRDLIALLEQQERLEEALQRLEELERLQPDDPHIPLQMGQFNERLDDYAEAGLHYTRAAELSQTRGDIEATLDAYRAALRLKPGDEAILTSMALLLEGEGRTNEAIDAYQQLAAQYGQLNDAPRQIDIYEKILTLQPGNRTVLETLGALYEQENNTARASDIYLALGRQMEESGDTDQAIAVYKRLKTVNPDLLDPHERLIILYKSLKRTGEAKAELRELAQQHHSLGDITRAEQYYLELKSLDPDDLASLEHLAKFYESAGDIPKAGQTYFELGDKSAKAGQTDKAIGVYQRIRVLDEENIDVAVRLFDLLEKKQDWNALWSETERLLDHNFRLNDEDQLERWSRRLREARPGDIALHLKLADTFQSFNLFDRALGIINDCAQHEIAQDRFNEAVLICNRGLAIDSQHIPLREALADAYLNLDARREALAQFENIAQIARDAKNAPKEEEALRRILQLDDSHIPSLRRLSDLLIAAERRDDAVDTLTTLSTVCQMENKIDDAIQAYLDVLALQPGNQTIRESLAELYLLERNEEAAIGEYFTLAAQARDAQDPAKARHYLEKIIDISDTSIEAYRQLLDVVPPRDDLSAFVSYGLRLSQLFRNINALADAAAVLQRILEHDPENMVVMEQLAEMLAESENNEEAGRLYKHLGLLAHEAGEDKRARRHFEMMLSLGVEDPDCLHKLGGLYERLKEPDQAAETLERAVDLYTAADDHTAAILVIQELISNRGNAPHVYEKYANLLIAIDDKPGAANQYALAAELHEQNGDTAAAIAGLERMFELDEHRLEERQKYAGLLAQAGRVPEALEQFHLASRLYEENNQIPAALNAALLAIKIDRDDAHSHRRVFDLYARLGETNEALEQARWLAAHFLKLDDHAAAADIIRRGLELDDEDLALHLRQAELFKKDGKTEDASQEYLRSAELAFISRKMDTAVECLQEAKALLPQNTILLRHLARIYFEQGRTADYTNEMIAAINLLLEQGMVEDVADLTAEMKAKLGATPELRQRLAENFVEQNDPILAAREFAELARQLYQDNQLTRAQEAIERAIKLQPDNLTALETKLNILTALNKNYEAFPILQTLAGLYQRQDRWQDAEAALLQLHELAPNDPKPLQLLVDFYSLRSMNEPLQERLHELGQMYQDNDQIQEAVDVYARIKNTFPDDIKALSAFVDLYSQIGSEHEIIDDYAHLAELYNKTGAVMEATKTFERILLLDPASMPLREKFISFLLANGQKTRAISEMFELARQCLEANLIREAQRILKQTANLEPGDPQIYIQLAEADARANARGAAILNLHKAVQLLRDEGDTSAILEAYDKIIALDPGDIDTRRERLNLLIELSRTEETVEAALELADVYIRREFYDLAEELYLQIIDWNPGNQKAWTDLAHIREILGHHDEMLQDYQRWADLSIEADDVEKALHCLKKITELDPENIDALRRYIDLFMAQGMEEDLVEPYLRLAALYSRNGEFTDAAKIYQRVVELDPGNDRALEGLTATRKHHPEGLEAMGIKRDEAEKAIWDDEAETQRPESAAATAESLDAVIANYRNILELNPDNAQVRIKLAEVLEGRGDTANAVTEYLAASAVLQNGDPARAKALCEKVLHLQPSNKIARDRLDKTVKKSDLFKALESAIDYSRTPDPNAAPPPSAASTGVKDKPISPGAAAPTPPNPLDSDIDDHGEDDDLDLH